MSKVTKVKKTKDGRFEMWWLYKGLWVKYGWFWTRQDARETADAQENSVRALNYQFK